MNEQSVFDILTQGWLVLAVVVFIVLFRFTAPYGRHVRKGWGPTITGKLAWLIMEAPAPLVFATCCLLRTNTATLTTLVFLTLWEAHYIHRAFVYPFSLRGQGRRVPAAIIILGFLFNLVNGYLNGRYIYTFSGGYSNDWLAEPRFIIGLGLFLAGYIINRRADSTLHSLRQPNEADYKVPQLGLYRWISCPNYFGEIVTWIGWAIATWSPSGLAFAMWTVANLAPRARAHHLWYHQHFPDYPPKRKALIPGLW